jgi:hypothetical protein
MKKLLGILGAIVFIFSIVLNNTEENKSDKNLSLSLSSIMSINIANAESGGDNPKCINDPGDRCKVFGTVIKDCDEDDESNNCKENS